MKNGKIVQIGTPHELVTNPVDDFVKEFVGHKYEKWTSDIKLDDLLQPVNKDEILKTSSAIVPVSTPLREILEILSEHEQLVIEKNGNLIGYMDRRSVMKYLSTILEKGG
jgi:osmoprotectant transport system ATP-binding protein